MFSPGGCDGSRAWDGESLVFAGPDWLAACAGLGALLKDHLLRAVARDALQRARSRLSRSARPPRLGDIDLQALAANAAVGAVPAWWPARMHYLRVEVGQAEPIGLEPEVIWVDPNRPGFGLDLAWKRIRNVLWRFPIPFAGLVEITIKGSDGRKALERERI